MLLKLPLVGEMNTEIDKPLEGEPPVFLDTFRTAQAKEIEARVWQVKVCLSIRSVPYDREGPQKAGQDH